MRRNPRDKYYLTEDSRVLEDADSGEQHVFVIDPTERIVIRSMLEEDIKVFISNFDNISSKEKRMRMRELYGILPKKNSQYNFFVIELIVGKEDPKKWDSIYGLKRIPIGLGGRYRTGNSKIQLEYHEGIEMYVYDKYADKMPAVSKMLKKVADLLGIDGEACYLP